MKKSILLGACLIGLSTLMHAQDSQDSETTKNVLQSFKSNKDVKEKDWSHFRGLDVGFSQILNDFPNNELVPFKSVYLGFNIGRYFAKFGSSKHGFETGVGLYVQSRTFDNMQASSFLFSDINADNVERLKQKYRTIGLHIPAMFTFNLGETVDKSFFISTGVVGRYAGITSYKEKIFRDGDSNRKIKQSGNFDVENFQADARLMFGSGDFAVFINYGLTSFYDDRTANLLTVGLTLSK